MKVIIAMDSFKESMTSLEAGEATRRGILAVMPETEVLVLPLADGGEGTAQALTAGLGGEMVSVEVTGPLGEPVTARYGILPDQNMAIMEMAQAAGLTLVPIQKRNPLKTSTLGVGEMIRDALDRECRSFLIGIGGSATSDGGLGMLSALGFDFLDAKGRPAGICGENLGRVVQIDEGRADPRLAECRFQIAVDVSNPLCGPKGAAAVYAPQKGAGPSEVQALEEGMRNFAAITEVHVGADWSNIPGAGAAGGLGFAFLAYLRGELRPGAQIILEVTEFERHLTGADFVLTGEGKLDAQTAMGKAPVGAAELAEKFGIPVIAFAGGIGEGAQICLDHGIRAYFPVVRGPSSLAEAMEPRTAARNLEQAVQQVFRLMQIMAQRRSDG